MLLSFKCEFYFKVVMVYVTKKMEFSASHRLFNPTFSDEKNDEIYDKCNNRNGHGHNYVLEVTVKGNPNPETGYAIDLKIMKKVINKYIIDPCDHKHLNYDVDFLRGYIPSVENLIALFWQQLDGKFGDCKLHKLRLYETPNSFADYFGEPFEMIRYE